MCIDLADMTHKSSSGYRYILSIVDHFSRFSVTVPLFDKTAESSAKAMVENFFLLYGFPERLHSDRGKEFCNQVLEGICKILKIKVTTTLGYDPSCNGLVERFNGILKRV